MCASSADIGDINTSRSRAKLEDSQRILKAAVTPSFCFDETLVASLATGLVNNVGAC